MIRRSHSLVPCSRWLTIALACLSLGGCVTPKPLPEGLQPIALEHVPLTYDDKVQDFFTVSDAQWQGITALFQNVTDGKSERTAIGLAVARLEDIAGEQTPIGNDGRKDYGSGVGRVDCIAESINTTAFLRLMHERGLLKHHQPTERVVRSFWCFDIVHWTAAMQDLDTKEYWAVDSWFNANGIPPVIQPLKDWYRKKVVYGYYASDAPLEKPKFN